MAGIQPAKSSEWIEPVLGAAAARARSAAPRDRTRTRDDDPALWSRPIPFVARHRVGSCACRFAVSRLPGVFQRAA
jgi:hypothetical protein